MSGHATHWNALLRELNHLTAEEKRELAERMDHETVSAREVSVDAQQRALRELFQQLDSLPSPGPRDGLSGRDHDQILYGDLK